MASGIPTEYQEEYCGMGGKSGGGKGKGRKQDPVEPCTKNLDIQPVGGRVGAKAREERRKELADKGQEVPGEDDSTVYVDDYCLAHGLQKGDNGQGNPALSDTARMTQLADQDPENRGKYYMYHSHEIEAMRQAKAMAAPDIHKLRYMSNNYMTGDDWH